MWPIKLLYKLVANINIYYWCKFQVDIISKSKVIACYHNIQTSLQNTHIQNGRKTKNWVWFSLSRYINWGCFKTIWGVLSKYCGLLASYWWPTKTIVLTPAMTSSYNAMIMSNNVYQKVIHTCKISWFNYLLFKSFEKNALSGCTPS